MIRIPQKPSDLDHLRSILEDSVIRYSAALLQEQRQFGTVNYSPSIEDKIDWKKPGIDENLTARLREIGVLNNASYALTKGSVDGKLEVYLYLEIKDAPSKRYELDLAFEFKVDKANGIIDYKIISPIINAAVPGQIGSQWDATCMYNSIRQKPDLVLHGKDGRPLFENNKFYPSRIKSTRSDNASDNSDYQSIKKSQKLILQGPDNTANIYLFR